MLNLHFQLLLGRKYTQWNLMFLKCTKNNFQPKAQKLNISTFQLLNNKTIATWRMLSNLRFYISSWWFQPIWKYLSNWIISPGRDENKTYLKPPPRFYRGSFWGLINKPRQNHPLQKVISFQRYFRSFGKITVPASLSPRPGLENWSYTWQNLSPQQKHGNAHFPWEPKGGSPQCQNLARNKAKN